MFENLPKITSPDLPEKKQKPKIEIQESHLVIYLAVAVAILILGILLTPTIPDEIIGEVILIIAVTVIEIRKKIDKSK